MLIHDREWRCHTQRPLQGRISNKKKEYISKIITIWVDIIEGCMNKEDYILASSEISSTIRWTLKSNFGKIKQSAQFIATRKLATISFHTEICIYVQHFKGIWNVIMDILSMYHHLLDNQLTYLLFFVFPNQTPNYFGVIPLHQKITRWLDSLMQNKL